jgi:pyruvate dehydrogenase E1 component
MLGGYRYASTETTDAPDYLSDATPRDHQRHVRLLFSGSAHTAVQQAGKVLRDRWNISADIYSITSYKRLRDDALESERRRRLGDESVPTPWVTSLLGAAEGPIVAVTDYVKLVPEQIARFVPAPFIPLGTDGYGRSDTREALRRFFEIDEGSIVTAALSGLVAIGEAKPDELADATAYYGLNPDRFDPSV